MNETPAPPGPATPTPVPGALFTLEFPFTLFAGMTVRFVTKCDIPGGRYALMPVVEEKK